MRKIINFLAAGVLAISLASCGGEGGDSGSDLKVSAEMKDFVSAFNGKSTTVEAQLAKYASSEEIKNHDMGMYNLESPEVIAAEGDCFTVKCKSGMVENTYVVCWKDKKIASITEKM